ncbi:MAG: flagellar hook-basal body complex protein FliE [Clostridiaceae bacterium]|jgi:flagellar hook-basal body complex protein FliE|nr:flagellar hook-basal body complex protein FliE [Clostridiaceae bacterium]
MIVNAVNNENIFASGVQRNSVNTAINTNEVNSRSFGDYLKEMINNTNKEIIKAEDISNQFAAGRIDDIHKVLIQIEKADIALQYTLQIRNKIMDAYNEIMRMQV